MKGNPLVEVADDLKNHKNAVEHTHTHPAIVYSLHIRPVIDHDKIQHTCGAPRRPPPRPRPQLLTRRLQTKRSAIADPIGCRARHMRDGPDAAAIRIVTTAERAETGGNMLFRYTGYKIADGSIDQTIIFILCRWSTRCRVSHLIAKTCSMSAERASAISSVLRLSALDA